MTNSNSSYDIQRFQKDLFSAMESRPNGGIFSGRPLGNSKHRELWTKDKIKSFYDGVVTSRNIFYSMFSLEEFAHLIISECMQESTCDYRLNITKPFTLKNHESFGLIQVTPASVLFDYYRYGHAVIDINGKMIVSPSRTLDINLADPCASIILFSWYTSNCVSMTVSINEFIHKDEWHIKTGKVTRDFGNCQLTWLAGPHNDRHTNGKKAYEDYYNRILDYFIAAGFGSKNDFDELISRPLPLRIQGISKTKIDNRNTALGLEFIRH